MPEHSLRTHLVTELRDLLDAEQQLLRALADFARDVATPALRIAFEKHRQETERHIDRLRQAFGVLGHPAKAKRCEAMQSLMREGNALISELPKGALRDAVTITSAQKAEHYEMASYGTARTYAQVLGQPQVAALLQETLDEEKATDAQLTAIAEERVNAQAVAEWHGVEAGLLVRTAEFAGRAAIVSAATAKRVASRLGGLRRKEPRPLGSPPTARAVGRPARKAPSRVAARKRATTHPKNQRKVSK